MQLRDFMYCFYDTCLQSIVSSVYTLHKVASYNAFISDYFLNYDLIIK